MVPMIHNENNIIPISKETIFAFVQPVGTDLKHLSNLFREACSKVNAIVFEINLTDLIEDISCKEEILKSYNKITDFKSESYDQLSKKMFIGSKLREKFCNDLFARYGIGRIAQIRHESKTTNQNIIYLLNSLKHPEEVDLLRETYRDSFFLIGVNSPKRNRKEYLVRTKNMTDTEANELINRDEDEGIKHGQKANKVFEQADFFIRSSCRSEELQRFIDLVYGNTKITPTDDEYHMHLAASSAATSGDLSRQVGAIIVSKNREIISLGKNEVPKFGGGQYKAGDVNDMRDLVLGYDPNHKKREEIKKISSGNRSQINNNDSFDNLTEYTRSVHAEMEALLACARNGISTLGSLCYTTTYPCHNCAKHLIGAGIQNVLFIQAYPKSHAEDLHGDALIFDELESNPEAKMGLRRFYGVGPRRFIDLFSQTLSEGIRISRKQDDIIPKSDSPWMAKVFNATATSTRFPVSMFLASGIEKNAIKWLVNKKVLQQTKLEQLNVLLKELLNDVA